MSEYIYTDKGMPDSTCELMRRFYRREEIVRCRDCYFADEFEGGYWCSNGDIPFAPVTPHGFCAYGKRRDRKER